MNYLMILQMKIEDNREWQKELQEGINDLDAEERFEVVAEVREMKLTEDKLIKLHHKIEVKERDLELHEVKLKTTKSFDQKRYIRSIIIVRDTELKQLYKEVA